MKNRFSLLSLPPLATLPLLVAACADPAETGTPTPTEGGEVAATCDEATDADCIEVGAGALILDEAEDTRNGVTGFRIIDDHTIEVGGVTRLAPGTAFMRGVRGHGLLVGRVTGVEDAGDGNKRFTFERARIQDVIPKARVRTRRRVSCVEDAGNPEQLTCTADRVTPGPKWGTAAWHMARAAAPLAIDTREGALGVSDCKRTWLNDSGNASLELTACHFTVDFDVDIDVSWGFLRPDSFSTSVSIVQDAGLTLEGHFEDGFSAGGRDDEVTLGRLGPINFTVGSIPMYVSGAFKAGYAVDVHAEAAFEAGFEYDGTDVFGFGWSQGDGLYKIRDVERSHSVIGPTWSVAGDIEARAYVRPEIEAGIGLDGILSAGATLSVELGARLDASMYANNDAAEACLAVELYATPALGYDLDVFGIVDERGSFVLADFSVPLFDQCVSTEEMTDPACETGRCDSDADCHYTPNAEVAGAPRGVTLGPKARACVTGACERAGSACSCSFTWTPNCCVVDEHCGEGGVCMGSTNRCRDDLTAADAARDGLRSSFACEDASACDDERPLTTDTCVEGDCVHTFAGEARPAAFQCGRDSDCEGGSFCVGGACLSQRIAACAIMSCNDGDPRTQDTCTDGVCSYTSLSVLPGPTP